MIFCTLSSAVYLAKAKVLARSIKRYHPNALIVLGFIEKQLSPAVQDNTLFDEIVLVEHMKPFNVRRRLFKYPLFQAATSLKATLMQYIFHRYPQHGQIVFLDADTRLYGPLQELEPLFQQYPIIITPHDNDLAPTWLLYGLYNSGFLGIARHQESLRFLEWWADRKEQYCIFDPYSHLFLDQGWFNLVPCFFNAFVLNHPGYNLSSWNLAKRPVTADSVRNLFAGGAPLRFIHYSDPDILYRYCAENSGNPVFLRLYHEYLAELEEMGHRTFSGLPWSYNYFDSGELISSESRKRFYHDTQMQEAIPDPFLLANRDFIPTVIP